MSNRIIYGTITAVTPDNGLLRVTVSRKFVDEAMELFVSTKSQYARKANAALERGNTTRIEIHNAKRTARGGARVPCVQIVTMSEDDE